MVCEKCEKKLSKIITPDPMRLKAGTKNTSEGPSGKGGRKVGENKALESKNKNRYNPYTEDFKQCRICKTSVHQAGCHFCQGCAYKKGICSMCGKQVLDTSKYKQCAV